MKWLNKGKTLYWLRSVHRDLGFLLVGVCFIYGISGFLLNHMNGKDPAFKTRQEVINIEKNLTKEELEKQWLDILRLPPVKKILSTDDTHIKVMCEGGMGIYHIPEGRLEYEIHQKRPFVYWINKMHYNRVNGWNLMADLFAVSLLFFAISGIVIVKGKYGIGGRGKWYLLAGLVIPVLYVIFS